MTTVQIIGRCHCPVCSSEKASLRLSTKQLAYVLCNACHFQGFARSDHSDTKLRSLLIPEAAPEPSPAPDPKPEPPPAPESQSKASWGLGAW